MNRNNAKASPCSQLLSPSVLTQLYDVVLYFYFIYFLFLGFNNIVKFFLNRLSVPGVLWHIHIIHILQIHIFCRTKMLCCILFYAVCSFCCCCCCCPDAAVVYFFFWDTNKFFFFLYLFLCHKWCSLWRLFLIFFLLL